MSTDVIKRDDFDALYAPSEAGEGPARFSSADDRVAALEAELAEARKSHARALQRARDDALAEASSRAREEWDDAVRSVREAAGRLRDVADEERSAFAADLTVLAVAVASKVLRREIASDDEFVVRLVRRCLRRFPDRAEACVRVHPEDLDHVRRALTPDGTDGSAARLRVVEDRRVDRGGCVVETPATSVDGRIATQLDAAREALAGEETP